MSSALSGIMCLDVGRGGQRAAISNFWGGQSVGTVLEADLNGVPYEYTESTGETRARSPGPRAASDSVSQEVA